MDWADFRVDEWSFLARQKLTPEQFFDGRNQRRPTYEAEMKASGHSLVVTEIYCRRYQHRLRTRSGHCIQCDPARIAFQRRADQSGIVYVAQSREARLSKVGMCRDARDRLKRLNEQSYGRCADWSIVFAEYSTSAGRVEIATQGSLAEWKVKRDYVRSGVLQEAVEMYRCEPPIIVEHMRRWIAYYDKQK